MKYNMKPYEHNVQMLYLPEYTQLLRRIQGEIDDILIEKGFQECLFPKLISFDSFTTLAKANSRFLSEWKEEAIFTEPIVIEGNKKKFALAHWQCEPFYFFLKKNPNKEFKFFEHSGWSYRKEKYFNNYRLFEFLRTEIVFCVKDDNAKVLYNMLIDGLYDYLKHLLPFEIRITKKVDEEAFSNEREVIDIEVLKNNEWIEIVGSHLHGNIFVDALNIKNNEAYCTGCCGIGLSRIVNLLFSAN